MERAPADAAVRTVERPNRPIRPSWIPSALGSPAFLTTWSLVVHTDRYSQRRSAAASAAALAMAVVASGFYSAGSAQELVVPPSPSVSTPLPDTAGIAAKFAPAVVNISVIGARTVSTIDDTADEEGDENAS